MNRREFNQCSGRAMLSLLLTQPARAAAFSDREALQALRASLQQGADQAIRQLSAKGGFLNDPKVRIGLPKVLAQSSGVLKAMGQGRRLDEMERNMNHAAEQAMSLAAPLLQDAIQRMRVADVQKILGGGERAVTDYFEQAMRPSLTAQFRPRVAQVTDRLGLARQYDRLLDKGRSWGLRGEDIASHVTQEAIGALFLTLGEQERALRQNPTQAGTALLRRVFGALR